jgi:nicotinamidase-related amidase
VASTASVLHRETTALAVIDIQERLATAMAHRDRVIASTTLLLRVAAIVGLPVVVTRQYPKGLGDHSDEIAAALRGAEDAGVEVSQIDKVSFDCFAEPGFAAAVQRLGREQLLVVGMETHICVCQTALAGLRAGYEMHVAADACCSREDDNHANALLRLGTARAVVTTSESAAYELVGAAGTPEFKALLAAVKGTSESA